MTPPLRFSVYLTCALVLLVIATPAVAQRAAPDTVHVQRDRSARGESAERAERGRRLDARASGRAGTQQGRDGRVPRTDDGDRGLGRTDESRTRRDADVDRGVDHIGGDRGRIERGSRERQVEDARGRSWRDETRERTRRTESSDYTRGDDRRRRPSSRDGLHVRPNVRLNFSWPWEIRRGRRWSPLYRYRQVVRIESGWNDRFRDSRLDVRTYYRHRVRDAHARSAELDVYIERIEIYEDGYFLGAVRRIPDELARVRALIHRGGAMRLDRELFIVGDPHVGFELISTRHYGGYVLDLYDRRHGYRAGRLDLRRERVVPVRRSRLFDPYDFSGFVPIGLLPENDVWLGDYGRRAPSRHWYGDDDFLYFGWTSDMDDYAILNDDRTHYEQVAPRAGTTGRVAPLSDHDEVRYRTERGVEVRMRRESTLERVE